MSLDTEIEALESMLMRLKDIKAHQSEALKEAEKWQPKGGDWYVDNAGEVAEFYTSDGARLFGAERETREQAKRVAVEMRRFNRLLALRDELCGDNAADLYSDELKYYVYFYNQKEWRYLEALSVMPVVVYFTTQESAQRACDMLNSGEVEL